MQTGYKRKTLVNFNSTFVENNKYKNGMLQKRNANNAFAKQK